MEAVFAVHVCGLRSRTPRSQTYVFAFLSRQVVQVHTAVWMIPRPDPATLELAKSVRDAVTGVLKTRCAQELTDY